MTIVTRESNLVYIRQAGDSQRNLHEEVMDELVVWLVHKLQECKGNTFALHKVVSEDIFKALDADGMNTEDLLGCFPDAPIVVCWG